MNSGDRRVESPQETLDRLNGESRRRSWFLRSLLALGATAGMALFFLVLSAPFAGVAIGVASLAVLVGFGVWSSVAYWGVLVVGLMGLLVSWGGLDDWRTRRRGEKASCEDGEDHKRYLLSGLILIAVAVILGDVLVSTGSAAPTGGFTYLVWTCIAAVARAVWRGRRRRKAHDLEPVQS